MKSRVSDFGFSKLAAAIAAAFFASACSMAVEVAAGRIISREIGASLYTWTSVIGVVLAGLTLGNAIGGRVADRFRPRRAISALFVASSLSCVVIPVLNGSVDNWLATLSAGGPARVAIRVTMVFLIPAMAMGTIPPVAAKMALDLGRSRGRTVGDVYAWANLGSILGTFLTGFWLIAWMGTMGVVWLVAGVLAVLGAAYGARNWWTYAWGGALAALAVLAWAPWGWASGAGVAMRLRRPADPAVFYQDESQYSYISVQNVPELPGVRAMVLDKLVHSQIKRDDPEDLQYGYEKIYAALVYRFYGDKKDLRSLTVGGGGYVFPRYLTTHWPGGQTEVVEIDPAVTTAAQKAFDLPAKCPILVHHMDGRNLVETLARRKRGGGAVPPYDLICGDAFNDCNVPFHLTTKEYNEMIRDLLSPDGMYLINLIDIFDSGRFLGAVVNTFARVFDNVSVIATDFQPRGRNTFIVLGSKRRFDLTGLGERPSDRLRFACLVLGEHLLESLASRHRGLMLTDDFAPVEHLVAPVVEQTVLHPKLALARRGSQLVSEKRYAEAEPLLRKALAADPTVSATRLKLGELLILTNREDEAVAVLRQGLEISPNDVSVLRGLGVRLLKKQAWPEVEQCFRRVLSLTNATWPDHYYLGLALMALGQRETGLAEMDEAVRADPKGERAHQEVGVFLVRQGRFARAAEVFRAGLAKRPEDADLANSLAWVLATCPEASVRNGAEAIRLAQAVNQKAGGKSPRVLDTLAAANAEAGRFAEAVVIAEQALAVAQGSKSETPVENIQKRLELYRQGRPYREAAPAK